MSVNSVMHGNKLFTLQPSLHEQLDQLQVVELTLPEDIQRMKTAKKRDQEQVGGHVKQGQFLLNSSPVCRLCTVMA